MKYDHGLVVKYKINAVFHQACRNLSVDHKVAHPFRYKGPGIVRGFLPHRVYLRSKQTDGPMCHQACKQEHLMWSVMLS